MTTQYRFDPALAAALVLASLFCFHGISWGRVECWNLDQMAMRDLAGLRAGDYSKPPFHTYLNHILVIEPSSCHCALCMFRRKNAIGLMA